MKHFAAMLFAVVGCLLLSAGATDAYASEVAPQTVSVEGVATVAISKTASQAEANAAYRQALAAAVADGLEKASFLATTTGATVGSIQQVIERGGSIECELPAEEGPLKEYEPYDGLQPDFGSVPIGGTGYEVRPAPAKAALPPKKKAKKKHKKPSAKKAAEATRCTLSTQIVLSYLLTTTTAPGSPAAT